MKNTYLLYYKLRNIYLRKLTRCLFNLFLNKYQYIYATIYATHACRIVLAVTSLANSIFTHCTT